MKVAKARHLHPATFHGKTPRSPCWRKLSATRCWSEQSPTPRKSTSWGWSWSCSGQEPRSLITPLRISQGWPVIYRYKSTMKSLSALMRRVALDLPLLQSLLADPVVFHAHCKLPLKNQFCWDFEVAAGWCNSVIITYIGMPKPFHMLNML